MEALAGVTAIEADIGAVTVRLVDPLIDSEAAWIVVLPVAADPATFFTSWLSC